MALDRPENLKLRVRREPACEVCLVPMPEQAVADLQGQKGVHHVEKVGNKLYLYGESVSLLIDAISRYVNQKGLAIISLDTVRPTLEDAFVELTGLSTEVMLVEKGGR